MHPLVGEQSYSRDLLKSPSPAGLDRFAHRGLRARASTCRRSPVRGFHPGVSRVSCSWRCALGEQFPLSPNPPPREKAWARSTPWCERSLRGHEAWTTDPETPSPFPGL